MTISNNFAREWQIVDSLEQQGLPKSALEKVRAIEAAARAENNHEQIIKAVIYRGKYTVALEEDGIVKAIQLFEKEEKTASQPSKSILQSMLGELYATYLSNNGWQLQQRTPVPEGEGGDLLTWSAAQIERRAMDYYLESVTEEALLAGSPVSELKELVQAGRLDSVGGAALRPTLLDLLAHRAIAHLSNERAYLSEPSYRFNIDQEAAFGLPGPFAAFSFETTDSTSGKWRTLQLFQRLSARKLAQKETAALIDLTLQRLLFVLNQTNRNDGRALYKKTLDQLETQYGAEPALAEIWWAQAQYFQMTDDPKNAVATCRKTIQRFPDTYAARQCAVLLQGIENKSLKVNIEQYNLPGEAMLLSVAFTNTQQLWYQIVALPNSLDQDQFNGDTEDFVKKLLNRKAIASGTQALPNSGDYREHRTEMKLDALPIGHYAILVGYKNPIAQLQDVSDFAQFQVTELSAVRITNGKETYTDFLTVDRKTGAPLAGIKAQLIEQRWSGSRYEHKVSEEYVSDKDGRVRISGETRRNLYLAIRRGEDLFTTEAIYNYRHRQEKGSGEIVLFTDRGLYRPGQMVYFKGIALKRDLQQVPSILPNTSVNVILYDANGQEKGSFKGQTNEFGTFNGVFTLPMGNLTGAYSLQADAEIARGYASIQVEEYKRPKFEVTFDPVEGDYRLKEQVKVSGKAMNYAGNPTDGASVVWRVVRRAYFPWWWGRWMPGYGNDEQEIANGTAVTGADGAFQISFLAQPSSQPDAEMPPVFQYEISADITDASGETRSNTTTVSVGKNSFVLGNNLGATVLIDSLAAVGIIAENLSGQKVKAKGEITLQALDAPQRIFRSRLFPEPDVWTLKEADFRQFFPQYAWNKEDQPGEWKPVGSPLRFDFDAGVSDKINLKSANLTPGHYKITMRAKDQFGADVLSEKIVWIKRQTTDFVQPDQWREEKSYEPGQKAVLKLGAAIPQWYAYVMTDRPRQALEQGWNAIKGAQTFEWTVNEQDRGDFHTHWIAVYDNRVYDGRMSWIAPWSNKALDIRFETFRDKLQPGSKESWRLRISGPGKEKVTAELVASMYDASLDQFMPFNWWFSPYRSYLGHGVLQLERNGHISGNNYLPDYTQTLPAPERTYPAFNWFDFPFYGNSRTYMAMAERSMVKAMPNAAPAMDAVMAKDEEVQVDSPQPPGGGTPEPTIAPAPYPASIRRNLNETVFFYPALKTDANGDVLLQFTMNEALTRWKLQLMAHTKDLQFGLAKKEIVTQKEVMITANAPRFLRAGDQIDFAAKVSNLTDQAIAGKASLMLLDAVTMQPIEKRLGLTQPVTDFSMEAGKSAAVRWSLSIPADFTGAVTWQVFADSKAGRDGEENTLPVVSNRMLVTETLPMALRGNQNKTFRFDEWKPSSTRTPHQFTLEFTSNPAWYAVQSLPYLMEYPHECSEQVFSRFYANTLASSVTQKLPGIRRVYDQWKGTKALESNLSKNQELKYALLEETPWVLDAQDEARQKQQIGLLFDLNRMADEQARAIQTLAERQSDNGGWPWFSGGQESWYITQYIACGMAHLERLEAFNPEKNATAAGMQDRALAFCQAQAEKQYRELEKLVKAGKAKWEDDHLDGMIVQYLYLRSFYPVDRQDPVFSYYRNLIGKYWTSKNLYQQGMLALIEHRAGDKTVAQNIVKSLRERAMVKEELGMYWPNDWGMYWYQLPIETQALMVEVFHEVAADRTAVDDLRIWMLKNKQTNRWESTKATAEAVYALLLTGDNWLNNQQKVKVELGGKAISPKEYEAGTGYFKESWTGEQIQPSWNAIKVDNPNSSIVWGAAYRQYFEDLDKITGFKKTGITLVRQVFRQRNSDQGPILEPIKAGDVIAVGDQLKVRVEIRADRAMEFVHLKDMRPAGCEPRNVLSGYRYQGGLGYYESTRDLATHFFIDYLPRGTYVLEYPLVATHKGNMSFGIASLQCMYAPEFTSHSEGIRIKID